MAKVLQRITPAQSKAIEAEWVDETTLNNIQLFTQIINVGALAKAGYPAAVIRLAKLKAEQRRRNARQIGDKQP